MDFVRQKFPFLRLLVVTCYLALFLPPPIGAVPKETDLALKFRNSSVFPSKKEAGQKSSHTGTHTIEHPSPVTHASTITGTVVDDNDAAIAGAAIKAVNHDNPQESFETTTDSQGKYILPVNFKSFPWETLQKFNLDITKDGFTTKQKLVDVIANRTAGAGRSVLKILDSVITQIGSGGGTHINSLGDLKVIIPQGALSEAKDIRTTPYNKDKQLPTPLPPSSFYTYSGLLTADGGDIEFNQPVTVQIANSLGFTPGTKIPIGYYNDQTRQWEDSGQMSTVSANGRWVEFQTTHFSTPDCNFPALPPPEAQGPTGPTEGPVENNTSTNIDTDNQASNCNASRIAMRTGNLYQEHFLPKLRAMNQDITLELAYNSTTAKPSVLLATQTDLDSRYTTQPETQSVKFEIEGIEAEAFYQNTWGKNAERFIWDGINGQGQLVSTGSYPYTIKLSNNYIGDYYTSDCFGCPPKNDTGVQTREPIPSTTTVTGRAIVNNQIDSSFGSGWNLANLKKLYPDPDGRVLIADGSGSSRVYDLPHEDIVTANINDNISVLLGNGDGTFQLPQLFGVGDAPQSVTVGDFNTDENLDVVTANSGSEDISVLLGNGDGTFQPQKRFGAGDGPDSVAVGDFNTDENLDVVTANSGSEDISVLLGNGDGTFQPQKRFGAGDYPISVAVGDFNTDENLDVVTAHGNDNDISVLLGNGDGTFQPEQRFGVGAIPTSVAVGDFNANPEAGEYQPPLGDFSKLKKNSDLTYSLKEKDGTVYNFNSKGLITSEVDRNGNTIAYTYNTDDQLETITYPGNVTYTFAYDPTTKKLQSVTDTASRTTQFVVNASGDLTQIINPDGTSKSFTYNADHLMLTKTNENNNTTDYIYDKYGRIKETLTPEFDVWNGTQVIRERVSTLYSPSDVKGLINDLLPGQGTPENPAPIVNPTTLTDEIGGECGCDVVKGYTNAFGSWTESQDGLDRKTTYTRDQDNNAAKITYPNGRVTDMTYDYKGNLLTVKENYNSAVTTFTYESVFNQVKTITDPFLNVTTFEYDPKGNLIQIKDDNNTTTEMTYLNNGLVESITQAKGSPGLENTTSFTYNPTTGNLLRITDPLTYQTSFNYDPAGNLKTILDAEGKTTTYTSDLRNNNLSFVEDHLTNKTEYRYDNVGNLRYVVDAKTNTTEFRYNEINLLSSILNPLNKTKQFTYNADRLLGRILDAKNQTIKFEYDAAHQLKYKYLPGETVPYGYDTDGNLTSVQDSDSKLYFTYDRLNLLTRAQTLSGYLQPATTIDYTYDKNNNRLTIKNPQAVTFKYFYDNLNRLTDIKDSVGTTTFGHYAYDALSRRTKLTYLNSTSTTYGYDLASQLTSLKNLLPNQSPFSSFDYLYNKVGYRKTMTTQAGPHQFIYDDIYRLTAADHPDSPDESFAYDPVGNRKNRGVPPNWIYNAANQLTDDGTYTYTYDDNGNMLTKTKKANPSDVTNYTYNSENQLVSVQSLAASVQYAYDGLGRRIQKDVSGVKTKYVYDNEDIIAEYNGSNVLQATYLHGPGIDEPIRMTRGGQDYYYHADGLGSITELTNSSGAVVQTYKYDAFGNIVAQTGTLANPFTYTGREFDSESGLYYLRARYYDPHVGRFLQEDPIGLLGGLNLYRFVGNNPVNFVDPLGLTRESNRDFLLDWARGQGGNKRTYGTNDIETQEMMNSKGVQNLRDRFSKRNCKSFSNGGYGSGQAAWDTIINPMTADWSSTAFQVGGFDGASVINNGNGTVTFTIQNTAGTHSFFYHVVPDRSSATGPMRNINQTFQWTEPINHCKCK